MSQRDSAQLPNLCTTSWRQQKISHHGRRQIIKRNMFKMVLLLRFPIRFCWSQWKSTCMSLWTSVEDRSGVQESLSMVKGFYLPSGGRLQSMNKPPFSLHSCMKDLVQTREASEIHDEGWVYSDPWNLMISPSQAPTFQQGLQVCHFK